MNKENRRKNVIIYLVIFIAIFFAIDSYIYPFSNIDINKNIISSLYEKLHQTQNIAPSRMYVNAWRLTKNEYVDATLNNQDFNRWRFRYVHQIHTLEDANVAINSMLASLNDPYTKFLQAKTFSNQKVILDSKITGVGVMFDKTGDEIVVNNVLKNSSAQKEQLLPGDSILSIDGKSLKNMSSEEIHKYIESNKGKKISMVIKRGDKYLIKNLLSKEIPLDTMKYRITKDNIAIITLANIMGEKALNDFQSILLQTNKTKGIIIDLRNNYGGLLANAIQMADMMLCDKEIVQIASNSGKKFSIYSDESTSFLNKPIVILVNKKTASAAEILAGSLRESANAIIIGEKTFGKNSIQQIIPMANHSGIVLTTHKYILPNGEDIHNVGIKPNYIYITNNGQNKKDILMKSAKKIINELVEKQ